MVNFARENQGLSTALSRAENDVNGLGFKVAGLENDKKRLSGELNKALADVARGNGEIARLRNGNGKLANGNGKLQGDVDRLTKQLAAVEKQLAGTNQQLKGAQDVMADLQNERRFIAGKIKNNLVNSGVEVDVT